MILYYRVCFKQAHKNNNKTKQKNQPKGNHLPEGKNFPDVHSYRIMYNYCMTTWNMPVLHVRAPEDGLIKREFDKGSRDNF